MLISAARDIFVLSNGRSRFYDYPSFEETELYVRHYDHASLHVCKLRNQGKKEQFLDPLSIPDERGDRKDV